MRHWKLNSTSPALWAILCYNARYDNSDFILLTRHYMFNKFFYKKIFLGKFYFYMQLTCYQIMNNNQDNYSSNSNHLDHMRTSLKIINVFFKKKGYLGGSAQWSYVIYSYHKSIYVQQFEFTCYVRFKSITSWTQVRACNHRDSVLD